jgi:HSP20 family protein
MNHRDPSTNLAELAHVAGHLEQMWDQLLGGQTGARGPLPYAPHAFRPAADVYETAGDVVVVLEIAGILGQEIDVRIEQRRLTVRGARRDRRAGERRRYSAMEIPFGPFERTVMLPADVDADGARARYADGLLEVTLPRRTRQTAQSVRIALA